MSPVCESWTFDPDCCSMPDEAEQELIDSKLAIASELLWVGSGRRYGTCEVTVRPCLRSCGGGSGFPWTPYKDSAGEWRNIGCGCHEACSCTELCEVVLPGPVASVEEVLIDGEILDPEQYRLDLVGTGWRLLRVDGSCWPSCSDMTVDCDQIGSFCVTYMQGIALSDLAIAAVSELTCQLVRACIPGCKCDLPKTVTQVVRRGVTISYDNSKAWIMALPMSAAFLNSVNPNGLTSESSVWSPDVPRSRTTPVVSGS